MLIRLFQQAPISSVWACRARTFKSRVYEYYDPEVSSVAPPVQLEVRKR
jgi:hypothetical protein